MYRNIEGYPDPTAGEALGRIMREEKRQHKATTRRKIYVASRYSGNVEENVRAAIGYCRQVIDMGYMPVASHLLYPQILDDCDPRERELGLSFGLALLRLCDEVWVFGKVSPGMVKEIKEARRLHKRILYMKEVNNE